MGPDQGAGFRSHGHRVLDTETGRIWVLKNFELNENMDDVREMQTPLQGAVLHESRAQVFSDVERSTFVNPGASSEPSAESAREQGAPKDLTNGAK